MALLDVASAVALCILLRSADGYAWQRRMTTLAVTSLTTVITNNAHVSARTSHHIALADYRLLRLGATYEEVVHCLGGPGRRLHQRASSVGSAFNAPGSVLYHWVSEDDADILAVFEGGRLVLFSEVGLK
jgi:hypothetical protein